MINHITTIHGRRIPLTENDFITGLESGLAGATVTVKHITLEENYNPFPPHITLDTNTSEKTYNISLDEAKRLFIDMTKPT